MFMCSGGHGNDDIDGWEHRGRAELRQWWRGVGSVLWVRRGTVRDWRWRGAHLGTARWPVDALVAAEGGESGRRSSSMPRRKTKVIR